MSRRQRTSGVFAGAAFTSMVVSNGSLSGCVGEGQTKSRGPHPCTCLCEWESVSEWESLREGKSLREVTNYR